MKLKEFDTRKEGKKLSARKEYDIRTKIIFGTIIIVFLGFIIQDIIGGHHKSLNGNQDEQYKDSDVRISVYVDNKKEANFPAKDSGKMFQRLECNKGGVGLWDSINWKLLIDDITKPTDCNLYFITGIALRDRILENNGGMDSIDDKRTPDFAKTAVSKEVYNTLPDTGNPAKAYAVVENGMYVEEDNYGRSFYYRGSVLNNNVIFAGFAWKIIRINGDGSIRLIFNDGDVESKTGTDTQIRTGAFNTAKDSNAYVGYMYGTFNSDRYSEEHKNENDSNIKKIIDKWYESNILNKDKGKWHRLVVDNVFCADRSMAPHDNPAGNSALGSDKNYTYYAAYDRLVANDSPSLKCSNVEDQFTVIDSNRGNRKLKYPVGLISADEVVFAGGTSYFINTSYYLYTNQSYWTMTPRMFIYEPGSKSESAFVFPVSQNGALDYYITPNASGNKVNSNFGIRPVINLAADTMITGGNGTVANPYVVTG